MMLGRKLLPDGASTTMLMDLLSQLEGSVVADMSRLLGCPPQVVTDVVSEYVVFTDILLSGSMSLWEVLRELSEDPDNTLS